MKRDQAVLRVTQKLRRNRIARFITNSLLLIEPYPSLHRVGTAYGGWWVPLDLIGSDAIVYSAGIGGDASFDIGLIKLTGAQVWGFDPTPFSIEWVSNQVMPSAFHFEPIGIWTEASQLRFSPVAGLTGGSASITRPGNDIAAFSAECHTLSEIMARLGHSQIDLLKMDIEGAEGPVLDQMLTTDLRPRVLCVEFDQPEWPTSLAKRIRNICHHGYRLVHVETWNYTFIRTDIVTTH